MSVFIEKYSPSSIMVRGDTKPIKDRLKAMGGKFGYYGGTPGWMFRPEMMEMLQKELHNPPVRERETAPSVYQQAPSVYQQAPLVYQQAPSSRGALRGPRFSEDAEEKSPPRPSPPVTTQQFEELVKRLQVLEATVASIKTKTDQLEIVVVEPTGESVRQGEPNA